MFAAQDVVARAAAESVVVLAGEDQVVARAAHELVLATAAAEDVVAGAAVDQVGAVFSGEDVVGGAADDDVVAVVGADEDRASAAADQDVVATSANGGFDLRLGEVEGDAGIADDLGYIVAGAAVNVGLQVFGVDQQHVVPGPGVEGVGAQGTGEPVCTGIAGEGVVAEVAGEVGGAQRCRAHGFAGGGVGDIAGDSAAVGLCVDAGAAALGGKRLAVGVGDEVGGLGFFREPILRERAGGEDFVAAVDEAGLNSGGEVDAGDVEFGQGLEFSGVGDAVAVGVLPDADRVPGGISRGELVVGIGVKGLQGGEAVGMGLGARRAASADCSAEVLGHRLGDVVDLAVAVHVHDDDAVLGRYPAGLFLRAAVVVDVEEDGFFCVAGELDAVAVEVEDERIGGDVLGGVAVAGGSGGEVEAVEARWRAGDGIGDHLVDGLEGAGAKVPGVAGAGNTVGAGTTAAGEAIALQGAEGGGVLVEGGGEIADGPRAARVGDAGGGGGGDKVGGGGVGGALGGGGVGDGEGVGGDARCWRIQVSYGKHLPLGRKAHLTRSSIGLANLKLPVINLSAVLQACQCCTACILDSELSGDRSVCGNASERVCRRLIYRYKTDCATGISDNSAEHIQRL